MGTILPPIPPQSSQGGVNVGVSTPQSPDEDTVKMIIQQMEEPLRKLVDKHVRESVDREKVFQYATVRRNDFYYRGIQHLAPTFTGTGELVDYRPVNNQMLLQNGSVDKPNSVIYDYVINHFRGDLRKFVGVLGQKSPNVKARPSWASDDNGIRRASIANDCAAYLRSQWDVDGLNRYLVLSLGKNGTTFIYTPFVTDADKYGTHKEPVWGTQPQKVEPDGYKCINCGNINPSPPACVECGGPIGPEDFVEGETIDVPSIVEEKEYPNGTVECHIHSGYDVTTPFYIKGLEYCPWLWKEYEDDASFLVSKYPGRGLEEDLDKGSSSVETSGGATASLGRLARMQASSPTGYGAFERPNRWVLAEYWIRPSMYLYLKKLADTMGDQFVQQLRQLFPRGLKLTFVNKKLVNLEHERLDEVWSVVKPETSEYLYADPIFNDYIQGADILNDAWNINIQLLETSIPSLMFDPNILDPKKIRRGFQPNEFIPVVPGTGAQLDKSFFRVPTSDPKPEIVTFQKIVIETLREIVGLLPAIWGGDENVQTAEQARRRLNQALMILATTWNEIRGGWSRAYRNACRQLARYSLGRLVSSQGDPESVTVKELSDLKELLGGGWDFECDQAIPMNWTQLRDFVQSIFEISPELAHTLGMDDPDNLDKLNEGIGIPGWKLRGLDERNRIRDLIGKLMQSAPVTDMMGQSLPSIQLDFTVTWNPQMMVAVIHDWLMSEDGAEAEGTPGYENVIAAGRAALQFMSPPPALPGAPPPQGAPPPPNPGEPLPGPLQSTQPPPAPEVPLPPLSTPGGGMQFNPQPMIQ